jgi:hypothetical protein
MLNRPQLARYSPFLELVFYDIYSSKSELELDNLLSVLNNWRKRNGEISSTAISPVYEYVRLKRETIRGVNGSMVNRAKAKAE